MANTSLASLDLLSLDFEGVKSSLKGYLKNQSQFKDYDFDGAAINVLLDIMAYNTTKNIFFYNMDISESFLDSAQLRDSVLSRAKDLNYTPRSARSAKARVRVNFKATGESQPYVLPKGSSFSTIVKNENFFFTIPDSITIASANTSFTFDTDIYEGIYLKDSYVMPADIENKRFRITNRNVDTRSITVVVFEDNSLIGQKYTKATTLLGLDERSKVYFLQASENGYYEILFGDNNIGRRPKSNAIIVIDYRVSTGPKSNGARSFLQNFDPTGDVSELLASVEVIALTGANEGDVAESIESVKYYAPRHFQVQERAVVPSDYEVILKTEFPEVNAVSAFGGENADPPQYGKVFIAVDLSDIDGFPVSKQEEYAAFIRKRTMLEPIFIEPNFTFFRIESRVRYNMNITTVSPINISSLVYDTIIKYNRDNLNDFACEFRKSPFTSAIDDTDASIMSNVTRIIPYKKVNPIVQEFNNIVLSFGFAFEQNLDIDERAVVSTVFQSTNNIRSRVKDDGNGKLWITTNDFGKESYITEIGTVNYDTGQLRLNQFYCDGYEGSSIKFYVIPKDDDVIIPKDTISYVEPDEIHIQVEQLKR